MYESHFGLTGPPFQLVPDPGFFFGSRGHSNALAFLQSAAHQGDGFLVVTGEIGAGKTTLVRTLFEGLDANQVLAATMVSTQLESGDLPLAILLAFGAPRFGETKAQLNASLEAFLIDLAGKGRRALLIVDEAQNLSRGLIEELRMLSNLQLGNSALLQVFLVGQPDLRTQMQAKSMEQLRQRVTASCHLGPLDANETRSYVQHRLRRVGWDNRPPIELDAYAQIHQWTAGIPRRINRLCNRLLLATFLEQKDAITAESVEQIARDLRVEIGESEDQPKMEESYVSRAAPVASSAAVAAAAVAPQAETPEQIDAPKVAAPATLERPSPSLREKATGSNAMDQGTPPDPMAAQPAAHTDTAIPAALTAFALMPSYSLAKQARAANDLDTAASPAPGLLSKPLSAVGGNAPVPVEPLQGHEDLGIEEEEERDGEPPAAPAAVSALPDPHGVVAAHEVALPPLGSLLGKGSPSNTQPGLPSPWRAPQAAHSVEAETGGAPRPADTVPAQVLQVDLALDLSAAVVPMPVQGTFPPEPGRQAVPLRSVLPSAARLGSLPAPATTLFGPLVCLVDSTTDYVKARALGRVLSQTAELPSVLIVHTGSVASLEVGEEISGVMPQRATDVHLDINEHGGAASAALAITRFDAVLRVYRPKAILAMGTSDTLLTCTLFAHKSGIPVLRNDAGRRRAWSRAGEEMNAVLLERLADTSYISDLATYYTLYRSGISTERVLLVGNLADNVVHFAAQHTVHPKEILRRAGAASTALSDRRGYALCSVQFESPRPAHDDVVELIAMLTLVARELPVLWAASEATFAELKSLGKLAALRAAHVEVAPSLRYLDCIDLLRGARCLLSNSAGHFLDEAVTLGVQGIVLGRGIVVPVKDTEALQLNTPLAADQLATVLAELLASEVEPREKQAFWDGATAARIAAHLLEWLPTQVSGKKRGRPAPATSPTATRRPTHPDAAIELMGAGAR